MKLAGQRSCLVKYGFHSFVLNNCLVQGFKNKPRKREIKKKKNLSDVFEVEELSGTHKKHANHTSI